MGRCWTRRAAFRTWRTASEGRPYEDVELLRDALGQVAWGFFGEEVVGGVGDFEDGVAGGDLFEGGVQLFGGGEGVAGAVDEEGGLAELREMRGAELVGLIGRMERVGEKQEAVGGVWRFGEEHGGLAAAVGMAG